MPRAVVGMSLVELMIALALGSLLVLGVSGIFVAGSKSNQAEKAISRVQQSGRLAVELLGRDIRQAGYRGCASTGNDVVVSALNANPFALRIFSANSSGALIPSSAGLNVDKVKGVARANSDILVVTNARLIGRDILADDFSPGATSVSFLADANPVVPALAGASTAVAISQSVDITATGVCGLETGDWLLLSTCDQGYVYEVATVSACSSGVDTTITFDAANNDLQSGELLLADAEVSLYEEVIWYVANTGREQNGAAVYSLYRLFGNQPVENAEEMVEGVEYLNLEAGELLTGGNVRYVATDSTSVDWDRIVAARFALLVQGFDNVLDATDDAGYTLLNTTINASGDPAHSGGRFLRKIYTSSQTLRNKGDDA